MYSLGNKPIYLKSNSKAIKKKHESKNTTEAYVVDVTSYRENNILSK